MECLFDLLQQVTGLPGMVSMPQHCLRILQYDAAERGQAQIGKAQLVSSRDADHLDSADDSVYKSLRAPATRERVMSAVDLKAALSM